MSGKGGGCFISNCQQKVSIGLCYFAALWQLKRVALVWLFAFK
jgi:hypothetical protein